VTLQITESAPDGSRWLVYREHHEDSPQGRRTAIVGSLPQARSESSSEPTVRLVGVLEHALVAVGAAVVVVRHPGSSDPDPSWRGRVPSMRGSGLVLSDAADGRVLLSVHTSAGVRNAGWLHPEGLVDGRAAEFVEAFLEALRATGARVKRQRQQVVALAQGPA
jgi:hypothetical protein